MTDPDDIRAAFQRLTRDQVRLAVISEAPQVAALHLDLALFGAEQSRLIDEVCGDG